MGTFACILLAVGVIQIVVGIVTLRTKTFKLHRWVYLQMVDVNGVEVNRFVRFLGILDITIGVCWCLAAVFFYPAIFVLLAIHFFARIYGEQRYQIKDKTAAAK